MRLASRIFVLWLAALLIGLAALAPAHAHSQLSFSPKPAKPKTEIAPPSEIQALLSLLADPKVQAWLQQNKAEAATPAPAKPVAESPEEMMSTRVEAMREHIAEMVDAVPGMPAEFAAAGDMLNWRPGAL